MGERLLIRNANLITMDHQVKGDWIALDGDRILAVGAGENYRDFVQEGNARIIDARGRSVVPGFVDSHFHLVRTAMDMQTLDLRGIKSIEKMGEILQKVDKRQGSIIATGLELSELEEARYPDRTVLDQYCNDVPLAIYSADKHVIMLNSMGTLYYRVPFVLAGVDINEKGIPTGVFHRQASARVDSRIMSRYSDRELDQIVSSSMPLILSWGLTTVAAMEGGNCMKPYYERDHEAEFTSLFLHNYPLTIKLYYQTTEIELVKEKKLRQIGGTLYVDGTLSDRTAALSFDYADSPGNKGICCFSQEGMNSFVIACCQEKLQISFDAIGDAAIEMCLNAFEYAAQYFDMPAMRHRIEHAELTTVEQMKRAKRLGVLLSVQPTYEGYWGDPDGMYAHRLGSRYGCTNQYREMIDAGVTVLGGSDSSITEGNPMLGIHYAVNHPVEKHRITLEEALAMYTINGAYGMFLEDEIGSLTPGKHADVVLLSEDLHQVPADKLRQVKVDMTVKDGEILYDRGNNA